MSKFCSNKNMPCEYAADLGQCQNTACAKQYADFRRSPEDMPCKTLIRCRCGNIIAGYEGYLLTVSRKGRVVTFSANNADITVMCEKCGRTTRILIDGANIYHVEEDI